MEYCSNLLLTMYNLYCSPITVTINLNYSFLIKQLIEEGRQVYYFPLPFSEDARPCPASTHPSKTLSFLFFTIISLASEIHAVRRNAQAARVEKFRQIGHAPGAPPKHLPTHPAPQPPRRRQEHGAASPSSSDGSTSQRPEGGAPVKGTGHRPGPASPTPTPPIRTPQVPAASLGTSKP
jgi:hypothetical protein